LEFKFKNRYYFDQLMMN